MHFRKLTENLRLNFDHVIAIHFTPALTVEDDEIKSTRAVLDITTSQIIAIESSDWDGSTRDFSPCSKIFSFYDAEAEYIWGVLKNIDRWE